MPNEVFITTFTTPEDYGAVGDGVTDDSVAIQTAFDSGLDVLFSKKTYLISDTIVCNRSIRVDFNHASFIKESGTMFSFSGVEEAGPLQGADYTRSTSGYTLTAQGYNDYTGMAWMIGTNYMDTHRDYYTAGFVAEFRDGGLVTPYPIDVISPSIYLISPVTVELFNGGNFTFTDSTADRTHAISIMYGDRCLVSGFDSMATYCYEVIRLYRCFGTTVENCRIQQSTVGPDGNSYLVGVIDSCYTNIIRCYMMNELWSCITTGGNNLCYSTRVEHCKLSTGNDVAFGDHYNGVRTQILSSSVTSCLLAALAVVDKSIIYSPPGGTASIILEGVSDSENAKYSITDTVIMASPTGTDNGVKVKLFDTRNGPDPSTPRVFHVSNLDIRGVRSSGNNINLSFRASGGYNTTGSIKNVSVTDSDLVIFGIPDTESANIDTSNTVMMLTNLTKSVGRNNGKVYGDISMTGCRVPVLQCNAEYLRFNSCDITPSNYDKVAVNAGVLGSNVRIKDISEFSKKVNNTQTVLLANIVDTITGTAFFNIYKRNGRMYYVVE